MRSGFRPELGLGSVTFLIIGSIVGSGIFFLPGGMLDQAGSPWPVMLAWIVGAAVALTGALMFAELGAAFPHGGGQYGFIRDGAGRLPGFLFSWTAFTAVQSGTIAAVAVAMANALDVLVGLPGSSPCLGGVDADGACSGLELPPWGVGFVAVGVIALLTVVNYFGVRRGALVNNLATAGKLVALLGIVGIALAAGEPAGNFGDAGGQFRAMTLGGFALAVSSSLFAYDGFVQATFIAHEVKEPRRTLPRAILFSTLAVAAIYLLATFAYFHVLPAGEVSPEAIAGDEPIASEAVGKVLGATAAGLVALAIVVSTFGTTNAYVLASPRIYHDVAKDGEFPAAFGRLSRHRTPTYGLWYGAIWSGLLALSGGFLALANLTVFGLYAFYLVTVVAYFRLRRRDPAAFQSFRAPLRPAPAAFFGLAAVAVLVSYAAHDLPRLGELSSPAGLIGNTTVFGALLILSGLAVYAVQERRRRSA